MTLKGQSVTVYIAALPQTCPVQGNVHDAAQVSLEKPTLKKRPQCYYSPWLNAPPSTLWEHQKSNALASEAN